jgi:YidC/Oxa1 family membrane protein insertase
MFLTANIFQPLIDVFEAVLKFFHNNVGVGWGLSIVLLTVVVRAILLPLTLKQFHSMRKLQELAPELKAIQAKYKADKQRQQQEVMKFYKENEVNPFASCLPLVAQLPVFIGLFYMLRTSLRKDICPAIQQHYQAVHGHGATVQCGPHGGAGFLFVPDLTNKATGAVLIVLIALYVGTQLASSLMMATPTMEATQRRIMLLMPLFFVVFVISFPAGLIVYWITTNAWTMAQQYVIKRRLGPVPVAAASASGPPDDGGGGSGGGGPKTTPNGSGSGGLTGMLRARLRPGEDKETAGVGSARTRRDAPPPPPPRKKKKRSGRRR